jgi:hypothetical protein
MKRWVVGVVSSTALLCVSCEQPSHEYFSVYRDSRYCAVPMCGGFFFKRLNATSTRCFDGSEKPECYAGDIDFSSTNLNYKERTDVRAAAALGHAVLRGQFVRGSGATADLVPNFTVSEVWKGRTGSAPTGDFYLARDERITCVSYPCENIRAQRLNQRNGSELFAGVELPPFGSMSPEEAAKITRHMAGEGVIVSAQPFPVSGPGGSSSILVASESYLRVIHDPNSCFPGFMPCTEQEGAAWRQAHAEFDALHRTARACTADTDCTRVEVSYPFNRCGGVSVNESSAAVLVQRARELSISIGAAGIIGDCPPPEWTASCVNALCQ